MDIELIINIAIILFIIFSVLKRTQEVSKKSQDIKKPPETSRPPLQRRPASPVQQETARRETPTATRTETILRQDKPAGEKPLWRQMLEELDIYPETERTVKKEAQEAGERVVAEVKKAKESPKPVIATVNIPDEYEPKPLHQLKLHFAGDDLVRGIVMSEILGQPVSMKHDL